jgi:hypothetical protein
MAEYWIGLIIKVLAKNAEEAAVIAMEMAEDLEDLDDEITEARWDNNFPEEAY